MSLLVLNIEGSPNVQAVRLDDPSPGYAAEYVRTLTRYVDPACVLRWCEVDVSSVADYGPDEIAKMLAGHEEYTPDLPQTWSHAGRNDT